MAQSHRIRASLIAKVLKKEVSDLKNYFKELDISIESLKNVETKESELFLFLKSKRTAEQEQQKDEDLQKELVGKKRERAKS